MQRKLFSEYDEYTSLLPYPTVILTFADIDKAAIELDDFGAAVVKLFSDTKQIRKNIDKEISNFPEFKLKSENLILGGFAAFIAEKILKKLYPNY